VILGENSDVISLGCCDVGTDVAELVIWNPAGRLGIVRRLFFQHLLPVQRQVLEVGVIGEWILHLGG